MPGAIIIGAGPGIGVSVARRFARAGFPIGVVARTHPTVDAAVAALAENNVDTHGATADAADESSLRAALDELVGHLGVPDVVVYNAAVIQWDAIGELTVAEHLAAWAVNVVGAITTAAHLLLRIAEAGGGGHLHHHGRHADTGPRRHQPVARQSRCARPGRTARDPIRACRRARRHRDRCRRRRARHRLRPRHDRRTVLAIAQPAIQRVGPSGDVHRPVQGEHIMARAHAQHTILKITTLVAEAQAQQLAVEPLTALHTSEAIVVNIAGRRVLGRAALREAMEHALVATSLGQPMVAT